MRTLRMTLAYDGTNYCGWQLQPNGVSLQQVVEHGLSQFTREPIRITASGRTDAGVHAIGQVISFETSSTAPCRAFLHGLPVHLPGDVVVRSCDEAVNGFNARFDATRKWYRYVIHNCPVRLPFLRHYALWQRGPLDDHAMNEAAQALLGTHDFRCFETQWPNRSTSIRTVLRSRVSRLPGWQVWEELSPQQFNPSSITACDLPNDASHQQSTDFVDLTGPYIVYDVEADGFLYNMVRAIVGTLIHVGRGRWSAHDVRNIVETGDRTDAGETAPANGLYLMQVFYDNQHKANENPS